MCLADVGVLQCCMESGWCTLVLECVEFIAAATLMLHVVIWHTFAEICGADQQTGRAVPARQYRCCRTGNSGLHEGKACCMNNSCAADGKD